MNSDIYLQDDADRERPAILYADGEYLATVNLSLDPTEAATVSITELEQGSALHRLAADTHVDVSLTARRRVHGWIKGYADAGYDLEVCYELEQSFASTVPGAADHATADLIREQLVEHLYHREQLHVALILDEPYAGPGATEEFAYVNGAITALCELALNTGLYRIVAAGDQRATTSLQEEAQKSLKEISPSEGKLKYITFARAVLDYLDGEQIQPH